MNFQLSEAFAMFDKVYGQVTPEKIQASGNFRAVKAFRDALCNSELFKNGRCFGPDGANKIAPAVEISVSDWIFDEYEEEVVDQLGKLAIATGNVYAAYSKEFNISMDFFIENLAPKLSFTLEM